jgi:hypothetical protein
MSLVSPLRSSGLFFRQTCKKNAERFEVSQQAQKTAYAVLGRNSSSKESALANRKKGYIVSLLLFIEQVWIGKYSAHSSRCIATTVAESYWSSFTPSDTWPLWWIRGQKKLGYFHIFRSGTHQSHWQKLSLDPAQARALLK